MGGVILFLILVLLIAILVIPALRGRVQREEPPPEPGKDEPHEVVVHRLDDHRKSKTGEDKTT